LHAENLRAVRKMRCWIEVSCPFHNPNDESFAPRARTVSWLKTTAMDVNFRKIDIDAYDEDVLQETELYDPDPRGPQQVYDDARAKAASVRTSLSK
jgi:hypothetical protein